MPHSLAVALLSVSCMFASAVWQPGSALSGDSGPDAINKNCPVGKEPTDGKTFVDYKGKTIGFCCPGCDKQFLAWSEERKDSYLDGLLKKRSENPATAKKKDPWTEPYSLGVCPVSGEKLGTMGDPVVKLYRDREIRFCCGGCIRAFEKDLEGHFKKIDAAIHYDQVRFYPLEKCVVSGKKLVDDGKNATPDMIVGNRLFRVADKQAAAELRRNPAKYVAKLNAATASAQRKDYPLKTCVVAGGELGSMGKPTEMVLAGRLLRFCCGGCEPKVKANPVSFLEKIDQSWTKAGRFKLGPTSRPSK